MDLNPRHARECLGDPFQLIARLEVHQLAASSHLSYQRTNACPGGWLLSRTHRCFRSLTAYITRLLPLTSNPTYTIQCPLSLVMIAHRRQVAHRASTVNQLKESPIHRIVLNLNHA